VNHGYGARDHLASYAKIAVQLKAAVADSLPRGTTAAIATSHRGLAMDYTRHTKFHGDSVKLPVALIQED